MCGEKGLFGFMLKLGEKKFKKELMQFLVHRKKSKNMEKSYSNAYKSRINKIGSREIYPNIPAYFY